MMFLVLVNAAVPSRLPGWREASPPAAVVLLGLSTLMGAVKMNVETARWLPVLPGIAALCVAAAGILLTGGQLTALSSSG